MGITHAVDIQTGGAANRDAALEQQGLCMRRALALDPNDALACFFMGSHLTLKGDGKAGDRYYQRALELGPNNTDVLILLAWTWSFSATPERGAEMADRAVRLNPHYPFWWNSALSRAYFHVRAFEKAYAFARRSGSRGAQRGVDAGHDSGAVGTARGGGSARQASFAWIPIGPLKACTASICRLGRRNFCPRALHWLGFRYA
jgi:tetratricopeptide (TPR) repeat protein